MGELRKIKRETLKKIQSLGGGCRVRESGIGEGEGRVEGRGRWGKKRKRTEERGEGGIVREKGGTGGSEVESSWALIIYSLLGRCNMGEKARGYP